jgi:anti-sigma factor RsiW
VSLLERLGRGHLPTRFWRVHLNDSQFARLWSSSKPTGVGHPHLAGCATCRARFAEFNAWMLGVGETLRAEADEAFPAERLAAQQAQIARRLETLERPARVIAFPKAARAVISGNSHVRRWMTVAAAAGLIAGIGLGQVVPLHTVMQRQQHETAANTRFTTPAAAKIAQELTPASTSLNDEELLSDAFARPRVRNLSALDDMTPHARDYGK